MTEPEPIHDPRDVVGTLVSLRRAAALRAARQAGEALYESAMGGRFTAEERATAYAIDAAVEHLEHCIGPIDGAVLVPRGLAVRVLAAVRASLTPRGHLAQRVPHEGLGYCGHRSESPQCVAQRALIEELRALVEAAP